MKKILIIVPILLALGLSTYIGVFYYKHLRGVGPAISDPPYPIADVVDTNAEEVLTFPEGFSVEVFARDLGGARVLAFDQFGNVWVSRTKEGKISVVIVENGKATRTIDVATGLTNPHGLLFGIENPNVLYIAEENRISSIEITRVSGTNEPVTFASTDLTTLVELQTGKGIHYTRSLAYTPNQEILVSIGSSCNVCNEVSSLNASIQKLQKNGDTWTLTPYATGLRNSVFMATDPVHGKVWATEMGRDLLGDNTPPDELNIIEEGKNYGWPVCFGNRIHDSNFDKNTYIMDPCANTVASFYDLPAHVAPLGLAFIPEESFWPEEYWNDLLVAYHGSWNRSVPVGYSIERIILDKNGQIVGEEPFMEGWLTKEKKSLGRPVDLKFMNGSLYISDDHAGVIYKVMGATDIPAEVEEPDLITVDIIEPYIYDTSTPSIIFTGKARGTMYFEASFPVVVTDDIGTIVAQGIAQAQSDWMTTEYVPFSVTVSFVDSPTTPTGKISFIRDNPSGLPENDYTYSVPVTFQ
ncbi:MAG: PQQ-dependent sugar dehydrogenase [Candidatus Magasanikbacteria bacterium]|nr:PQQ-dependent sugar dehydrogenase [Candidatus Magasanikbacteria bacterium]